MTHLILKIQDYQIQNQKELKHLILMSLKYHLDQNKINQYLDIDKEKSIRLSQQEI